MTDRRGDHDGGLPHDLEILAPRTLDRRRALGAIGAAALLSGCGRAPSFLSASADDETDDAAACVRAARETPGPYPADGSNASRGATSNVLTETGVVRSDIRSNLVGAPIAADGVPLTLTIAVVDARAGCAPLQGWAVYLWHCDREARYSLYDAPEFSYLRGAQIAGADGRVTFTTVFPGCYGGRFPHMHFQLYPNAAAGLGARAPVFASQLAMPSEICAAVYNEAEGYQANLDRYARVSMARDGVFRNNSAAQIAAMTPIMTGGVADGYVGEVVLGV